METHPKDALIKENLNKFIKESESKFKKLGLIIIIRPKN